MEINIDFEAIKEKVGDLAQAGVAQTKRLATIAKLKSENMVQRDAIRKAYIAIGKQLYTEKRGNPDEGYAGLFAKVDAAMAAIAANNAALEELRKTEDVVIDVDVEMQAGEVPEDGEPTVDEVVADVQDTVAGAAAEDPAAEGAAPAEVPDGNEGGEAE